MTREQLIEKLKQIDICVTGIVATYDMGIQIDILTGDGACQNIGNVGNFPVYKIQVTEDVLNLQNILKDNPSLSIDDLLKYDVVRKLCTYVDIYNSDEWLIGGDELSACLIQIKSQLPNLNPQLEYWYAYADLSEQSKKIDLFETHQELCSFCKSMWDNGTIPYDNMSNEELQQFYKDADSSDWYGVPLIEI